MSVFSLIRRGRRAAKEHNAKQDEKERRKAEAVRHQHEPTHAASDAFPRAPTAWSWRDGHQPKVVEQHQRRSAMATGGAGMGTANTTAPVPAIPRVNSSLSQVAYPSVYAPSPVVQMSRAYSYSHDPRVGEADSAPREQASVSSKGKEVERVDSRWTSQVSSKSISTTRCHESWSTLTMTVSELPGQQLERLHQLTGRSGDEAG